MCDTILMAKSTQKQTPHQRTRPRKFVPVTDQEPLILDAAAELFLKRGYEGVSIDALTAVVGGSKRDIYALFGDKETLFRRAVEKLAMERADLFLGIPVSDDLRTALRFVGARIISVLLSPRSLALHRLMTTAAARVPEAAETFLHNAPHRAYATAAHLLRQHAAKGDIIVPDPDMSARIFVGALVADLQLRALLGKPVDEAERQARVDAVVEHLLDGISASR